jgi:hypothetical protein
LTLLHYYANELINMHANKMHVAQLQCIVYNPRNYNVSSIIPERIIKIRLVDTEELHGNEFLSKFCRKTMDFVQNEVINVQMNDTIFILSTKLIYVSSSFENSSRFGS